MITYFFHINHPFETAFKMIVDCANANGQAKNIDEHTGHLFWKYGFLKYTEFYVQKTNTEACEVHLIFKPSAQDYGDKFRGRFIKYDAVAERFYKGLMTMYPNEDFGISLDRRLLVVEAKVRSSEFEQVYRTSSVSIPSLSGFVLGGLAFGVGGAVVGGMSGNTSSVTSSDIVPADKVYVQAILSNGRYTEGWLGVYSPIYQYIKINLLPTK